MFNRLLGCQFSANAERIKDVSMVEGVRSNQLVGYGLVVGLPGTGEQSQYTQQSFRGMLKQFWYYTYLQLKVLKLKMLRLSRYMLNYLHLENPGKQSI